MIVGIDCIAVMVIDCIVVVFDCIVVVGLVFDCIVVMVFDCIVVMFVGRSTGGAKDEGTQKSKRTHKSWWNVNL